MEQGHRAAARLARQLRPGTPQSELLVDEWGVWDRMIPEEEKKYGRLWQQITMRSAVAARHSA